MSLCNRIDFVVCIDHHGLELYPTQKPHLECKETIREVWHLYKIVIYWIFNPIILVFKLRCTYTIDHIFRFRNGSNSENHCIYFNNFSPSSSSHNSYCSSRICIHTILPRWMLEKPELVCPPDSIQKGELIGSGQYGMVYKGSYNHGTARFVYDRFSFHSFKIWK